MIDPSLSTAAFGIGCWLRDSIVGPVYRMNTSRPSCPPNSYVRFAITVSIQFLP